MVVRRHPETGERHLDLLQRDLGPHWSKDLPKTKYPINARVETVGTSGMFRGAFAPPRWAADGVRWLVGRLSLVGWHRAADVRHHHHQRER